MQNLTPTCSTTPFVCCTC